MEVDRRYTVAMEDSVREGELVQVDASASLLTSTDSYGCFVANVDARGEEEEEEEEAIVEKVIQELDEKIDQTQLTDSAMELLRLVPDGYLPLPHQVGGHRHIDGKLGFLRRRGRPDLLYKPLQEGSRGLREVEFYDFMFGKSVPDDLKLLKEMIPLYFGCEDIADRAGNPYTYLKLEDLTQVFSKPCILDVKIGRKVWDHLADQDKIDRELKKYPAQQILGFRITGMRVYRPSKDDYIYYDRFFGRSVTECTAEKALSYFLDNGEGQERPEVLAGILSKLQRILAWTQAQCSLRFYATSLLIVYEGDVSLATKEKSRVEIRLVDFAHTYHKSPGDSDPDENLLFGMEKIVHFMERLKCIN